MLATQQAIGPLAENRLKNTQQRLGQLVVEIVARVDRNIVLQRIQWILGLFIRGTALRSLDNHIRHTVAQRGR